MLAVRWRDRSVAEELPGRTVLPHPPPRAGGADPMAGIRAETVERGDRGVEVEGWILDAHPGAAGGMVVWIKTASGETVRLADRWQNAIYVSADHRYDLEWLEQKKPVQSYLASSYFVRKREHVFDYEEREVLKLVLRRGGGAGGLGEGVGGGGGV